MSELIPDRVKEYLKKILNDALAGAIYKNTLPFNERAGMSFGPLFRVHKTRLILSVIVSAFGRAILRPCLLDLPFCLMLA